MSSESCFRPRFPFPTTAEAYDELAQYLYDSLNVRHVNIWSLNPVERQLILTASAGADLSKEVAVIDCEKSLSGWATDSLTVRTIDDITRPPQGRHFHHPDLIEKLGLRKMLSVPVRNRSSPHQVLFVINVFPGDGWDFGDQKKLEIFRTTAGEYVESCLRQECLRAGNRMNYEVNTQQSNSFRSMCLLLAKIVSQKTGHSSSAVFVETMPDGADLEMLGFAGDHRQLVSLYEFLEERSLNAWKNNREQLVMPHSKRGSDAQCVSAAIVPLRDAAGFCRGTMLVFDPLGKRHYTYENIAVMESLGTTFTTRLQMLLADRRKETTMARLSHEMRVPITAFRAAIEQIKTEMNERHIEFEHEYLEDLDIYAETMQRNVREMQLIQQDIKHTNTRFEKTYFERSIVRPAVRFAQPQLEDRGFNVGDIIIHPIADVLPPIYIDRGLMTQVVSNLLENGVKFAKNDPKKFKIEIRAGSSDDDKYLEIYFRDWGVGVPEGFDDRIFQEGTRGPGAGIHDVLGDGLGLYVARQFARLHGGDVVFRRNPVFTEFVIKLPRVLRHPPAT